MTRDTAFQWNLGGWLGGQLGGTCWILVAAAMAFPHEPRVATIVLGLFLLPNLIGWRLWAARDRLAALRGMQIMVLVAGAFGVATVYVLDRSGLWEAIQVGGQASSAATYAVIVGVVAGLLLLFHTLSRRS